MSSGTERSRAARLAPGMALYLGSDVGKAKARPSTRWSLTGDGGDSSSQQRRSCSGAVAESKESREVVHADGEGEEKTLFPLVMGLPVDKGGTGRRAKLWAVRQWVLVPSAGKRRAVQHYGYRWSGRATWSVREGGGCTASGLGRI
jgi:hypothetical protein